MSIAARSRLYCLNKDLNGRGQTRQQLHARVLSALFVPSQSAIRPAETRRRHAGQRSRTFLNELITRGVSSLLACCIRFYIAAFISKHLNVQTRVVAPVAMSAEPLPTATLMAAGVCELTTRITTALLNNSGLRSCGKGVLLGPVCACHHLKSCSVHRLE